MTQLFNCFKLSSRCLPTNRVSTAVVLQIGHPCSSCVRETDRRNIVEGDFILSTASFGTRFHFKFAGTKRKEFERAVFDVQDKRHQKLLLEEKQTSGKKIKTEFKVSFAELELDSDEES